jgi:hypothetical protein
MATSRYLIVMGLLGLAQPASAEIDFGKLQDVWESVCWKHSLAVKQNSRLSGFDPGFEDCARVLKAWQIHASDIAAIKDHVPAQPIFPPNDAADKAQIAAILPTLPP